MIDFVVEQVELDLGCFIYVVDEWEYARAFCWFQVGQDCLERDLGDLLGCL